MAPGMLLSSYFGFPLLLFYLDVLGSGPAYLLLRKADIEDTWES